MEQFAGPRKKLRSPVIEGEINTKTAITCTNVPEGLFDPDAAKKHFLKFGKIQKIRLFPKRQMCIIEYEQPLSVEAAVLNAGAYDGFMFDVTRTKPRVRKSSKKSDSPAWGASSEVEEELSAMSGAPSVGLARMKTPAASKISASPRIGKLNSPIRKKVPIRPKQQLIKRRSKAEEDPEWLPNSEEEEELLGMDDTSNARTPRQKPMEGVDSDLSASPSLVKIPKVKYPPMKTNVQAQEQLDLLPSVSGTESPVPVATLPTTLTTAEAAAELNQLRYKTSLTPDEQWRTLDARDRILRAWGGAGSRVKVGGATIGTCPDMCPEKERLHRQAEHQVMTLETIQDSDGELELWRAVKQYSRSSADQEIPMCYELRPAPVLMRTCAYLLNEIADTNRQVSLADWFHFMWDRFRGVRKDITQQALCCPDSIRLVEMCARFHAHCAARLADLEHTQFDQKLNTDNLTKCLQTLKHMYADVKAEHKPREAEFRGYVALLNMGDANFWWEIKQLPKDIQKSDPILFAIKTFNALDNNNYVKFFRLVKYKATYLQACILLRYFNDVRARALARIVKAFAPRGSSRYPAEELMESLAFESLESMKSFITHYGLRFAKTDDAELSIILDRNKFIEDTDPYPLSRAVNLIESKRRGTVGEAIIGGPLPKYEFAHENPYSSFTKEGKLKESALIAEDQNYNTLNDSNKDIQGLKSEMERLAKGGKSYSVPEKIEVKTNNFVKPEPKTIIPIKPSNIFAAPINKSPESKLFLFKPAIPVAPTEIIKNSPEKIFDGNTKNIFSFSKPQESPPQASDVFKVPGTSLFNSSTQQESKNVFATKNNENKESFSSSQNLFKTATPNDSNPFIKQEGQSVFGQFGNSKNKNVFNVPNESTKVFGNSTTNHENKEDKNIFGNHNIFSNAKSNSVFGKSDNNVPSVEKNNSIFGNPTQEANNAVPNVFGAFSKPKPVEPKSLFAPNGEASIKPSPGSLFKSAVNSDSKEYSIFLSKSKDSVAKNIFNSVNATNNVYDFDPNEDEVLKQPDLQTLNEQRQKQEEERIRQEEAIKARKEEERKQELLRQEEERRKELERRKQEELKILEERRKKEEEERKQEELKKKLEEEKKAELKRKAEEERKFKERVDEESSELVEELTKEVNNETTADIMREELDKIKNLMAYAGVVSEEILTDLCNEICHSEMRAEKFWTEKLLRKWFYIWRKQLLRNLKRRSLLEDTPVWIPDNTPIQEACHLRRLVEQAALKNMNAIHRGYRFSGELKQLPSPQPYDLMDIIKSSLLKRMKQINYPYGKCFFWKVSLISLSNTKWLCRKIDIEKWILDVFSDGKKHDTSNNIIHVAKQSWNNLLDFAISVGFIRKQEQYSCSEAIDGTNGLLFYINEKDMQITDKIDETLRLKYPYQVVPVIVIIPKLEEMHNMLETYLNKLVSKNTISDFQIYVLDEGNLFNSLNSCTKSALKWLAKKYPQVPPLEIDHLKSLCQRYLGNEIWCRLRSERNGRLNLVLKDLRKLVKCYNIAVDKLTDVITNEDLFNYPSFPLEFKTYLDESSPYPNPYEFIPSSAKNAENISAIKDLMKQLKLPDPRSDFQPLSVLNMQHEIRSYCNQIGWFEETEEVVCKVVAILPDELLDENMPCEQFTQYYEHYDLIDLLNVIIYEKINRLNKFNNRYAIYEKKILEDYRNLHWLHEVNVLSTIKHKAIDYEDEIDVFIEAKRRKIALDSMEYLMLEDKDCTLVEENIKAADVSISKYNNCNDAVKQLEEKIEEEKMKSIELENLLRNALSEI